MEVTEQTKTLRATKMSEYVIEPRTDGYSQKWEGFCATNPAAIRLSIDQRVFLGYRAAGDDDRYITRSGKHTWRSSLGLAVMDARGEKVVHRFPLPVFKSSSDGPLPQTKEDLAHIEATDPDLRFALHDFRFHEDNGWLYLIYHNQDALTVRDFILRMKVETFVEKVDASINLLEQPVESLIEKWQALWWNRENWEDAGVHETHLLFGSPVHKGDTIFVALKDGTNKFYHRPRPDIGAVYTGKNTFVEATPDGLAAFGSLETCVRPGYHDNSHIGSNGEPALGRIGDVEVYVDVTHGVYDEAFSTEAFDNRKCVYLPFLRLIDYETGDLLYYSEEPILDRNEVWKEYVEEGNWVNVLEPLDAIMFPGGVVPVDKDKIGIVDEFAFYTGLGDTAVGRAVFTLREILPDDVIEDILQRKQHGRVPVSRIPENAYTLPGKIAGWEWTIAHNPEKRCISVLRQLVRDDYQESGERPIFTRPGFFDADVMIFDGESAKYIKDIGWAFVYKGVRWIEENGNRKSLIGFGVIVVDEENPEKILYRSVKPIQRKCEKVEGWDSGDSCKADKRLVDEIENHIPEQVKFEIKRINYLIRIRKRQRSRMTRWLENKSNQIQDIIK